MVLVAGVEDAGAGFVTPLPVDATVPTLADVLYGADVEPGGVPPTVEPCSSDVPCCVVSGVYCWKYKRHSGETESGSRK